ncbi:MAG: hypothetical protein WCX64_01265 [Candidatus Micrarchaeia archaeon]
MNRNEPRMLFFALIAVVLFSPAALALDGSQSAGQIELRNESYYTPFPVEPGTYFDFFASVKNAGKDTLSVTCGLDPKYPFSMDAGEENYRTFTRMAEAKEALLNFRVHVADTAVEGTNYLDFTCKNLDTGQSNTIQLKVSVKAKASTVNIVSVVSDPETIRPGQKATLNVFVNSASPNYLRDFKISLGVGSDAFPFAVVGGTNEKLVSEVAPYQSANFSFELMAYPSASSGVYKLPITVTYSDKLGRSYSINQSSGLVVGSEPNLEIAAESTEVTRAGSTGKVIFRVMNRGLVNVKTLRIEMQPSKDYVILTAPSQFIGSINADDFETAEFSIHVSENATGPLALNAKLYYSDTSNAEFASAAAASLPLFSQVEAIQYGLEKIPDNTLLYIILLLVVLYLLYKYALPPVSGFVSEYFGRQKAKK